MKKINTFAMFSAIALAGSMGIQSCSSEHEVSPNSTLDGESVKTQFAISLTKKAGKQTRMTAGQAQEEGKFRGIKNIQLFPVTVSGNNAVQGTDAMPSSVKLADFTTFEQNSANVKVYGDIPFPIGTNAFLFYGQAGSAGEKTDEGKMTSNFVGQTIGAITFTPQQRVQDAAQYDKDLAAMIGHINGLHGVINSITGHDQFKTALLNQLKNTVEAVGGSTYQPFSASSANILTLVQMLYDNVNKNYPTEVAGAAAGSTTKDNVLSGLLLNGVFTNTTGKLSWASDPKFPSAELPEGCAAVVWDNSQTQFRALDNSKSNDMLTTNVVNYVHPVPLCYFANTPAGVKDATYFNNATSIQDWKTVAQNYKQGAIDMNTKSVILMNQIQYAVADFVTTVRFSSTGSILDAKGNTVSVAKGFPVTGVLVGDQKQVDWKFEQVVSTSSATSYTLYDNKMTSETMSATSSAPSAANHTLVFESEAPTQSGQKGAMVNVAIEMVNNSGEAFYGQNGLIPAGGKFYLTAQLNPSAATGVSGSIDRVFKQDHKTVANFTISSLAKAYNVIPDLRSTKLEFGLSVDLTWQDGLTFDVPLGQ